jgi:hypothetical protein
MGIFLKSIEKSLEDISSSNTSSEKMPSDIEVQENSPSLPKTAQPYSAFTPKRRTLILVITTVAGFFGPLSGGIYLPALPILATEFEVAEVLINATVSVFMVVFAIGVSSQIFFFQMYEVNDIIIAIISGSFL